MTNDSYTMAKHAPEYRNRRITFTPQIERIIGGAIAVENACREQRELEQDATPPGQLALFGGDVAA